MQTFDGEQWTNLQNFGTEIYAIEWGTFSLKFLVGGKGGTVKTYDGVSWVDISSGWGTPRDIYAIDWSNSYSYWLVGGRTGTIKSYDSSSWTDRTSDADFSSGISAISIELNE